MPNVFLTTYSIRLVDTGSGQILTTDSFKPGTDLLTVFSQYVTYLSANVCQDTEAQRMLKASKHASTGRTISGIVQTGDWGYEGDLVNVQSQAVTHHRGINEALMLPFYFLAGFPNKADEAILLMQRLGQLGIKTIFCEKFEEFFNGLYPGITVIFYPLAPADLINQYLDAGRLAKVRFIKYGLPTDIADHLAQGDHVEEEGYLELIMHAKRNGHLPLVDKIREFLTQHKDLKAMYEIKDFDYDNVKLEVDVNGRLRTIDLSHIERLRTFYDVTDEIEMAPDGHPSYPSINLHARTLMNDILTTMGIEHV
jgi:hypothetical protein